MSIEFLNVIFLVQNGCHVVVFYLLVRRLARYVITVTKVQREVYDALLTIEVFLLIQRNNY